MRFSLGSKGLCEAGQAKFGGTVGRSIRPATFACHGGDIDDGPAPRLAHMWDNSLCQQEGSTQVHIQDVVPIVGGKMADRSWDIDPCCVYQNINASEELDGALHRILNVPFVCQIAWERDTATTTRAKFCGGLLEVISTACQQDDIRSRLGESKSRRASEPTTGPCHQSNLFGEGQGITGHEIPPPLSFLLL